VSSYHEALSRGYHAVVTGVCKRARVPDLVRSPARGPVPGRLREAAAGNRSWHEGRGLSRRTAGGGAAGPGAGDGGPARVRAARPGGERGAGSHYAHDAQTFADRGADFVKIDECGGLPPELIPERKELNEKGNVDQSDQDSVSQRAWS
jgi:hypothetical protein